jgi:hypothetical protein
MAICSHSAQSWVGKPRNKGAQYYCTDCKRDIVRAGDADGHFLTVGKDYEPQADAEQHEAKLAALQGLTEALRPLNEADRARVLASVAILLRVEVAVGELLDQARRR